MGNIFTSLLTFSILALATFTAHAATEKSKYCPSYQVVNIKILNNENSNTTFLLEAYNTDAKYFSSQPIITAMFPTSAIELNQALTNYDNDTKTLSCVYMRYSRDNGVEGFIPVALENHGSY